MVQHGLTIKNYTMKKILFTASIFLAINTFAQDSTKIKGLQLQAKILEYLVVNMMYPDNDSLYQVYIDLRPKFRVANPPQNNNLVTIDSIPTVELANLYNYALSNSDGYNMGGVMRSQLSSARTANSYLDRLCTIAELFWSNRLDAIRTAGRKLLKGK